MPSNMLVLTEEQAKVILDLIYSIWEQDGITKEQGGIFLAIESAFPGICDREFMGDLLEDLIAEGKEQG